MPNIQLSLWKHPFTFVDKNNVKKELPENDKALIIGLTAVSSLFLGPFAIFVFYGLSKHLRDRNISLNAGEGKTPAKTKGVWNAVKQPAKNDPYLKRVEDFKKLCQTKKIDVQSRRANLYNFFTKEHFVGSEKDYDFGIEDEFGVFYIVPKDKNDRAFLDYLSEKYPYALEFFKQTEDTKHMFSLTETTRIANNSTFTCLQTCRDKPQMLKMLKDTLLYCILAIEEKKKKQT